MKMLGKVCKQGIIQPQNINQVVQTWEVNKSKFEDKGKFPTAFGDID
jgi:hypothetical protein